MSQSSGWTCQECGRRFRTTAAAQKAVDQGCPKCGGTDIDLGDRAADPVTHSLAAFSSGLSDEAAYYVGRTVCSF